MGEFLVYAPDRQDVPEKAMNPRFPIYIVSKGRADSRLTSRFLEAMKVPYYIIVEVQEYEAYASVIDPAKVLVLPAKYQENYDTFDNLGDTKSKGPGAARNFAWDHSVEHGAEWHWVMDDNIRGFCRMNNNVKLFVTDGTIFYCMEDFVLRYKNVAMAGPNYWMFLPRKRSKPPLTLNTRIYSCNLIRNDLPFRWRGRYNEDTDLSLRILKAGWCTVLFNAFVQIKAPTQTVKGGCNNEFYRREGTLPKSQLLVQMHPDVTKLVFKFRRYHHTIDYKPFARLKPVLKPGVKVPDGVNDYGMRLVHEPPPWYGNGSARQAFAAAKPQPQAVSLKVPESSDTIPRVFYRVWMGAKQRPPIFDEWWDDFKRLNPSCEFITLGDREAPDVIVPELADVYTKIPVYPSLSDIYRFSIMKRFGGVYVDCDVKPIRSFEHLLDDPRPFIGKFTRNSCNGAIIGSPPNHPAIVHAISQIPARCAAYLDKSACKAVGPGLITDCLMPRPDVRVLPKNVFYLFGGSFSGQKLLREWEGDFPPETLAVHVNACNWARVPGHNYGSNINRQRTTGEVTRHHAAPRAAVNG